MLRLRNGLLAALCACTILSAAVAQSAAEGSDARARATIGQPFSQRLADIAAESAPARQTTLFLRAFDAAASISELGALVDQWGHLLVDPSLRVTILRQWATVLESANRYDDARAVWAEIVATDPNAWDARLAQARLHLELGRTDDAVTELTAVVNGAPDLTTQRAAAIVRARAFLLGGELDRAATHARALVGSGEQTSPLVEAGALFLLWEVARAIDDPLLEERAARSLTTAMPDSPEASLVRGAERVSYRATPSRILGVGTSEAGETVMPPIVSSGDSDSLDGVRDPATEDGDAALAGTETVTETPTETISGASSGSPRPRAIQTGSFRDPENASWMARDIEQYGFETEVEPIETDRGRFYRVLVPLASGNTEAEGQRVIVALKERGVEGFLIFANAP